MSLKIGQVNLIDGGTHDGDKHAIFNVMYSADDAFKNDLPADYGVAVYAGKKLLSACKNKRHTSKADGTPVPSGLSALYSGDPTTPQGYTNSKGIKDWKTADSEPGRVPPRGWTGLEPGKVAVNMYYASSAGPRANQAAMGAKSGGVHTIVAYADNKIVDAVIVTVELVADMVTLKNKSFTSLGITGVHGMIITNVQTHDERSKFGTAEIYY